MIRFIGVACVLACSSEPLDLLVDDPDADVSDALGSDARLACGGRPCACSNGVDDDGDGTIDGFDAECTSGFDDDEGSFSTGRADDNRDPFCQDCFFDGNSGTGDDGCRYPTSCLVGGEATPGDPCGSCTVSSACQSNCLGLTPNGCDCFGCCSIESATGSATVALGPRCTLATLDDPDACPPCIPSSECFNPCGRCELCPGRTIEDLPEDCSGSYECDDHARCETGDDCDVGEFCSLGCCLSEPI